MAVAKGNDKAFDGDDTNALGVERSGGFIVSVFEIVASLSFSGLTVVRAACRVPIVAIRM